MDLQGEQLVQARSLRAPVGEVLGSGEVEVGGGGEKGTGGGEWEGESLSDQGLFLNC